MRMYEDYLDEVDRATAIQEAKNELEMTRLNFMLEMVERKYEVNCKNAELKVLTEGGTYDDLEYLYEEAKKEKDGEKQGIITTIINAIISVINSITTAISNFFNGNKKAKKDPNKIIKVPKEEADESSFICSKFNSMKATISDMSTTKKVLALGGMATALVGTYVVGKKTKNGVKQYKEMKQKEVDEQISTLNAALGFFKDKLASIPNSVRSLFGADKKEKTDEKKEDTTGDEPKQDGENNTPEESGKTEDNNGATPKQKETDGEEKEAKGGFIESVQKPVKKIIEIIKKILGIFGVGVEPDEEKEEPSEPTNDGGKKPESKEENNDDGGGASGNDDNSGKKDETPDSNQDDNSGTKTESVDDDFWDDTDLFSENFEEDYFDESVVDYDDMDFDHILDSI